ncbi:MAG: formimidoylglutamate deiminase [Gammaproteobacteria bacterium]
MMPRERRLNFRYLATPGGLARERAVVVDEAGMIRAIEPASGPWDGTLALPGMPNAHSHVFQRALAGCGEARSGEDSFWSWREAMYRLAARVDADALYAIARYAYGEMLAAGFTSVAEFHYLHHRRDGARGTDMAEAVLTAAREVGIRLRLLPVLYQRGGFDRAAGTEQMRFVHERTEDFLRLLETLAPAHPGLAFHSLRAVAAETLAPTLAAARDLLGADIPVHIHIAEQRREVADCRAASGHTPVELLMQSLTVDKYWSLVHATHCEAAELKALHETGATIVVCPLTEAYLGDGLFPGRDYFAGGGRVAIGSDSNARIDAIEELRWLEYGQRLRDEARARFADAQGLGLPLWQRAAAGGARALALPVGAIAPGCAADFVVLESEADALLGHMSETWADALIVGGSRHDLAAVYVGGERLVEAGEWNGKSAIAGRYHDCVRKLLDQT